MTTMAHPVATASVDGGYSGQITLIRGQAGDPSINPDLILVEAELVEAKLYLTPDEAAALGARLVAIADPGTTYMIAPAKTPPPALARLRSLLEDFGHPVGCDCGDELDRIWREVLQDAAHDR